MRFNVLPLVPILNAAISSALRIPFQQAKCSSFHRRSGSAPVSPAALGGSGNNNNSFDMK